MSSPAEGAKGTAQLRRRNLSRVLTAVYAAGGETRVGIARGTGLTKTAVGALAAQLLSYGLLEEDAAVAAGVGRPGAPLRFVGHRFAAACIEVRASSVETLVADLDGGVLDRRSDPTHLFDERSLLDLVISNSTAAFDRAAGRDVRLLDVVVAVHGVVDPATSRVRYVPRFDWTELDLKAAVSEALPLAVRVVVENDANLAALAECERYRSLDATNLVSIASDSGVGAGAIINGELYRGSHGFAAELGHMILQPDGPPCVCGRQGCWSALVGIRNVLREALPGTAADLEELRGYESAARDALQAAAESQDESTLAALRRAGSWLGRGAANIANVLDPQVIVVGGYLADLERWVMPEALMVYRKLSLRQAEAEPELRTSSLGDVRALIGGIHLSRTRLLDDPVGAVNGVA